MVNRYLSNSPYGGVQTSPCGDRLSPTPETGVSLPSGNGVRLSYGAIQQSTNNKNAGEKYFASSSKSNQNYNGDRYQLSSSVQNVPQERSSRLDRFHAACGNIGVQNSSGSSSGSNQISDSRYSPGRSSDKSYLSLPKPKDRFPSTGRVGVIGAPVNSSSSSSSSSGCNGSGNNNNNNNNNTVGNDRAYASAHTPVERYVPQPPPEILYPGYADLYIPPSAHTPTDRYVPAVDPGDPYMRRDLGFHHHYRLPPPGYPYHHQSHFRFRGFAYSASPQGRMGGSPGSSSSTSSTTSVQREFTTSPLLRQKSRGNNTEFNSSATGPITANQRHASSGTNHLPCCSEQNSQPPSQSQRVCCQPSRRSMPVPCNAGNVTNIPTQNSNPHTTWQPSPGSGTTSTSTVSSSGQDVGIGVTSQSISMYAVGAPGSVNGTGSTCSSVGGAGGGGSGNVTGTGGALGIAGIQGIGIMTGGGVAGGSSSKISESSQNPSSTTTSPPPPVPLTTITSGAGNSTNLSRSASAPTGPTRPVVATPSFVSHRNENENQRLQRTVSRTDAIKNYIKRETATFFGVDEDSEAQEKQRWLERRRRMASRKYGALLPEHRPPDPDITRDVPDASEIPEGVTLRRWHQPVRRKDSVARMTLSGLSYMVTTMTRHRPRERDETRPESRSFPPSTVPLNNVGGGGGSTSPEVTADEEEEAFFERPPPPSPALTNQQQIANDRNIQGINSAQQQDDLLNNGSSTAHDLDEGAAAISALSSCTADTVDATSSSHSVERDLSEELVRFTTPKEEGISSSEILSRRPRQISRDHYTSRTSSWRRSRDPGGAPEGLGNASSGEAVTLRRQAISGTRISPNTIDRIFDNSNRRQYGMGIVGRFFGRSFRKSVAHKPHVKKQLDDIEDQRPFFTYWITTVQVLILVISLACYGFGPFGFELSHRTGSVLVTSLSLQQVDYQEPANFWIGPRAADLIHLGAKFAPCMRRDIKILKEIDVWRERERDTACCIRNDDSGCVQSSKQDCSNTISTWKKWGPGDSGPGGRISGSVCGLDPKFCDAPASIAPYEWPDDITKWPICRKTNPFNQRFSKGGSNQMFPVSRHMDKMAEHMVCEVIGHPCCIGIHGMCRITTKEYCDFVHGYFHEEASLCSQVECLHDVCGMIPFLHPEWPDQFYRLFTSIFLHAGIFHLAITLCVQYFFMRDLEKLTGSFRIAIIYFTGGLAGNLASAIFVPYRAEVGPAGAHFALLATLVVEVLNSWPMLKHPRRALSKLLISLFALLILGALPWIDNYAHLFGFVFGFLAAYAVMPFISFGRYDRRRKILLIWICLILIVGLFAMLLALFYNVPAYECEICKLFTCIPFTKDFCASQNINFKREEPV
ncbi:inactive rhomboid protein 1 isoform X2 [Athalia rosae]|uniref:inactive rhomboid protein 1 isoform X2 n=1 Tax=Athalia rosae TaxID=37344 RepID=UPI0020338502|nr:inactive rhomboid protein 1 isoform X2 [Athalia rosae]